MASHDGSGVATSVWVANGKSGEETGLEVIVDRLDRLPCDIIILIVLPAIPSKTGNKVRTYPRLSRLYTSVSFSSSSLCHRSQHSPMSTLAVLPLQHPLILLPASRITIPVKKELGQQLASLIQETEAQPVLAAVPIVNADSAQGEAPVLNEWACVARITRLVRPSALNPSETYLVTLHGLTRVRLARPLKLTSNAPEFMPYHPVEYGAPQKEGQVPAKEVIDAFKRSSLRLLEKLGQDSGKGSRRDAWSKFSSMVEDISDQRVGWLADVMVGSIISEYADKLGAFLSYSLLSAYANLIGNLRHRISGGVRPRGTPQARHHSLHQADLNYRGCKEDCARRR